MTEQRKILILLGNTRTDSFSGELADVYHKTAAEAGFEVQRVNIGDLRFDPILHKGYSEVQSLEPDLVAMQEKIKWADHLVILYPNWWVSMPAILKGMFDRMWLPGFAFHFNKETHKVEQLLAGKTARVIVVDGVHSPFMTRLSYGDYTNEIAKGILGFAGIDASVTAMGPCEHMDEAHHNTWVSQVRELAAQGI